MKLRIGIVGYGNLGRGTEFAIANNPDMELRCILTRRDPKTITPVTQGIEVYHVDDALKLVDEIDVMILCGGSATDLPEQTPHFARHFNVVDSYDNHDNIPEHFENVDAQALLGGKTAIISIGWDPGLFSMNRMLAEAILPQGNSYTFWGKGVSQGHSDAIRRIKGVVDARQYTIPVESALDAVRSGANPELGTRDKHTRECFVVPEEGADLAEIEREIVTMPSYFADYDTTVNFVTLDELRTNHAGMPHGGFVIRSGKTGNGGENNQVIDYGLKLDSNPEFTSSVLVACARAAFKFSSEGIVGCKTIFDIPPAYFSPESPEDLRKKYL